MTQIKIRNVGPIKSVDLDLNRVNVFIGPQSSGKSTIAKIISYCAWVEKDIATQLSFKEYHNTSYFIDNLSSFHKMKGYFDSISVVEYSSDVLQIKHSQGKTTVKWVDKYAYKRSKISYIPAERNMIILPEMEKVELPNNNIRSFLFDWFSARKTHLKDRALKILSLPISYDYDPKSGSHIKANNNDYDVLLDNASSGLQSLVPLVMLVEYLTEWIYTNDVELSFEERNKRDRTSVTINVEKVLEPYSGKKLLSAEEIHKLHKEISNGLVEKNQKAMMLVSEWSRIRDNLFTPFNTNLIIEEPEQNLFPSTQADLLYYLLNKCLNGTRNHTLTLTTHSPYILYALNNCLLASKVSDKMPSSKKKELHCKKLAIQAQDVSVYKITGDGNIENIQDEDGLIGSNYFDDIMKEIMNDYYCMLNYYGNE